MTSIDAQPPRYPQAILESLGADPEVRDSVIGDLNQEFAERVERFGDRAARLWYYREAVQAMPHLARNWLAGAQFKDARRLLNVAGLVYVLTMMTQTLIWFTAMTIWIQTREALGLPTQAPQWLVLPLALLLTWSLPVVAGYAAASLEASRPLIAAIAAGIAWASFVLVANLILLISLGPPPTGLTVPVVFRVVSVLMVVFGSFVGGSIRVWRQRIA